MGKAESVQRAAAGAALQPLYRQFAETLRNAIRAGDYPVGDTLPSVRELADAHGLSQQTVRDALGLLRSGGLVSTRRRGGTRVEPNHVDRSGHVLQALDQLLAYGDSVRLEVTRKEVVIARTEVAELLQCAPGQAWLKVSGYRHLRGDPRARVALEVYINSAYPRVFEKISGRTKTIFSMFQSLYGETFVEFRQEVRTIRLPPSAAETLQAPEGAMGLRYVNRFIGEFGDPMEVSVNMHLLDDPEAMSLRRAPVVPALSRAGTPAPDAGA
jgi:DNA-binding GntR family transcriptional regulator